MAKFILRVDDVGWVPPDKTVDSEMLYFSKWRKEAKLEGCPVYYGLIPNLIKEDELRWCQKNLKKGEELAVHGNTHAKGERVEQREMRGYQELFDIYRPCRSYIPPFNDYHLSDVENWAEVAKGGFFFGGFHNEHHRMGNLPVKVGHCYHLPAPRELYGHSEELLTNVPKYLDLDCPMVVTLHCTWGWRRLDLVEKVCKLIKPHLVSADYVKEWLVNSELNLQQLTAPHYLAYKSVTDHLGSCLGLKALDFGARYSALPSLLALRGYRVTAVDRDEHIHQYQDEVRKRYGSPSVTTQLVKKVSSINGTYDLITCCWALQHNLENMDIVVRDLVKKLEPGGRLMVVGSYNHDHPTKQLDRPDPQVVLDQRGYEDYIIRPSGLRVLSVKHFHYEHNTTKGDYCDAAQANAVFYELLKERT